MQGMMGYFAAMNTSFAKIVWPIVFSEFLVDLPFYACHDGDESNRADKMYILHLFKTIFLLLVLASSSFCRDFVLKEEWRWGWGLVFVIHLKILKLDLQSIITHLGTNMKGSLLGIRIQHSSNSKDARRRVLCITEWRRGKKWDRCPCLSDGILTL